MQDFKLHIFNHHSVYHPPPQSLMNQPSWCFINANRPTSHQQRHDSQRTAVCKRKYPNGSEEGPTGQRALCPVKLLLVEMFRYHFFLPDTDSELEYRTIQSIYIGYYTGSTAGYFYESDVFCRVRRTKTKYKDE